jgi:hypothetical protein
MDINLEGSSGLVTTHRPITITTWIESRLPVISERRAPRRLVPPAAIGLAGTLLLHTLVLQTALLGGLAHNIHPPEIQLPGLPLNKTDAKPAESLVFINLSRNANANNEIAQSLAYLRVAIKNTPIAVTPPDPLPLLNIETLALDDEKPSALSVDSGDGTERARLFGIYTGQIQARIERIWRRPRSPVNESVSPTNTANTDESFQCQVQIVQDGKGYVKEVLLPICNGTVAWQHSLVLAIQQASPLPAPPSPTVFSHSIALKFLGLPYVAGAPDDDYEIVPIRIARGVSSFQASRSSQSLRLQDFATRKAGSPSPASDSTVKQTIN